MLDEELEYPGRTVNDEYNRCRSEWEKELKGGAKND
jgi:hypothetical protein